MPQPEIVADQQTLEAHCRAWRAAGRFAFDTEFIRDETYHAALCLIQVSTNGEAVLVDPTGDLDTGLFWELVADESVVTIVHAGKEDFEVCLQSTGRVPRNVFDVQIAAGLVGYGYPLSLLRLVEQMLHHRIAKAQTLTDWLRRPLTPEQVRYAADDVAHLPQIYTRLRKEVERVGRTAWAGEEFKRFEEAEFYRRPVEERVLRLKGSSRLDGLGLLVLERLVAWREGWARSRNRPLRALMRDDVLVEVARRRPRQERDLEVMRGFPQARNRKVIRELLQVIAEAVQTPQAEWPQPVPHREDSPMTKAVVDLLRAVTQSICHEEQLSWSLLGSPQQMRELLDYASGRQPERPTLLRGWREEFIGRRLIDLLEGRSEIHLSGWPDNPRLDVVPHSQAGPPP